MQDLPVVSVIIPCYNQAQALQKTLASLCQQSLSPNHFEVLVVDDGSTDDTDEVMSGISPSYRLLCLHEENRGASAARNLAASKANGAILLFLDADMVAGPDLVIEHLGSHSQRSRLLVAGNRKRWAETQVAHFATVIDVDSNVPDNPTSQIPISFKHAFSCNLSIRKEIYWQVGGFDETMPRWHDIDFAYRATLQDVVLIFNPKAIAYHNHPMRFGDFCQKQRAHHQRSVLFFRKYPGMVYNFSYLIDKLPIDWRNDPIRLIGRKLVRQLIGFRPVLSCMEMISVRMEKKGTYNFLQQFIYWKIVGSYQLKGLRDGIKAYGDIT